MKKVSSISTAKDETAKEVSSISTVEDNSMLKSEPRDWSKEISQVKEEKRNKRLYFKRQRTIDDNNKSDVTTNMLAVNKNKKLETIQRRESFKEKFIDFDKEKKSNELKEEEKEEDVDQIKDMMPFRPVVYNLAYFANDSKVLQTFIDMGVMIRKWDKDKSICEFILKLDLERDVKPHLIFLHDIKIPADKHARVIQNNPMFFKESLDDLQIRIDYLKSKKFTDESIANIIMKAPRWLSLSVEQVDTKLGWFQSEFYLTGSELRQIVTQRPKLVTLPLKIASDVRFALKEFLSYSDESIKRLIKIYPKLFTKDFKIIEANFNYLTSVLKLTNQQIESYPPILQTPLLLIRTRYAFLKHLKRVQFDPTLPNYISLKSMIEPDEAKFIANLRESSLDEYKKFLKTI